MWRYQSASRVRGAGFWHGSFFSKDLVRYSQRWRDRGPCFRVSVFENRLSNREVL